MSGFYNIANIVKDCLCSCAKTIRENNLDSTAASEYLEKYAETVFNEITKGIKRNK